MLTLRQSVQPLKHSTGQPSQSELPRGGSGKESCSIYATTESPQNGAGDGGSISKGAHFHSASKKVKERDHKKCKTPIPKQFLFQMDLHGQEEIGNSDLLDQEPVKENNFLSKQDLSADSFDQGYLFLSLQKIQFLTYKHRQFIDSQLQKYKKVSFILTFQESIQISLRVNCGDRKERDIFLELLTQLHIEDIVETPPSQSIVLEGNAFEHFIDELQENFESRHSNKGQSQHYPSEVTVADYIGLAVVNLREGNIFSLDRLWKEGLFDKISACLKRWDVYKSSLEQSITKFTRLVEYKMKRFSYNSVAVLPFLYPKIQVLVQRLLSCLKLKPLGSLIKGDPNWALEMRQKLLIATTDTLKITDKVVDFIFERGSSQEKKEEVISYSWEEKKHRISKLFSEKTKYKNCFKQCSEIMTVLLTHFKTLRNEAENHQSYLSQQYFRSIVEERVVETRCLGCSPFFVKNFNIWDPAVNFVPFKIFKSVRYMKEMENQIKHQLCMALNSGGGVILFDGEQDMSSACIKGAILTERDKELYEQRFMSYLDAFQPRMEAKGSIKLSFVPIINRLSESDFTAKSYYSYYSGQQSLLKPNETYKVRHYIQGCYSMRVVVCPANATSVFFWREHNSKELQAKYENYVCHVKEDGVEKRIRMKNLRRQIKKKMNLHFIPESLSLEQTRLAAKPEKYFDHKCKDPEPGQRLGVKDQKPAKKEQSFDMGEPRYYANASMIVAKEENLPAIQQLFQSRGVDCKLQVKFKSKGFSSSKHSAMMYHDKPFTQIQRMKDDPQFNFHNKKLVAINITNYLFLKQSSNAPELFREMSAWIQQQFPRETIRLLLFIGAEKQEEYYIQTGSRQSTLFAYYLLNHFNHKTLFKNPQYLDRMSQQQKKQKFIEVKVKDPIPSLSFDLIEEER